MLICLVRLVNTFRLDRVDLGYALCVLRNSGLFVLLQAGGRIWTERALAVWLCAFLICLIEEVRPKSISDCLEGD